MAKKAKKPYLWKRGEAVKPGSPSETDIDAMSDPAKRRRAAVRKAKAKPAPAKKADRGTPALDKYMAEVAARKAAKEPKAIQDLRARITKMRLRAKEVGDSKTGNVAAKRTYLRVAREIEKRLSALRTKK